MAISTTESDYHDVLTHECKLYDFIRDTNQIQLLMDPLYKPIIQYLRSGPKTVKEIESYYNKTVEKPKSEKSIYRYLKTLVKAGLLVEAGQRIVKGRNVTEILYMRTAKIFYIEYENINDLSKAALGKAEIIGRLLKYVFDGKEVDVQKFGNYMREMIKEKFKLIEQLLDSADAKTIELLEKNEWDGFTMLVDAAATIAYFCEHSEVKSEISKFYT